MTVSRLSRLSGGLVLVLAVALASGCDQDSLNTPDIEEGGNSTTLFSSYVALGNSITAGFQSGGIIDTTQETSYAVLLSRQLNTPFGVPALADPGCPPPYQAFFNDSGELVQQRPPGTDQETCGFRTDEIASGVNNVALPSAKVADATSNETGNTQAATFSQFLLGGRTQVEAALDANPTFVSVWIGNNDVLIPARQGSANVTPQNTFESEYKEMLDELSSSEALEGGVLIGVTSIQFTPFFSPGPVYENLEGTPQFPSNLNVQNCASSGPNGLTPLVPLSYGFKKLGQARSTNQPVTIDCSADAKALSLSDVQTLVGAVQNYNSFIQSQAQQRGFAYLNPNSILRNVYQDDNGTPMMPTDDPIPKFPAATSDQPFGPFFSKDGIHPNDATHRLVANELIKLLNQPEDQGGFGTDLSTLENVPETP